MALHTWLQHTSSQRQPQVFAEGLCVFGLVHLEHVSVKRLDAGDTIPDQRVGRCNGAVVLVGLCDAVDSCNDLGPLGGIPQHLLGYLVYCGIRLLGDRLPLASAIPQLRCLREFIVPEVHDLRVHRQRHAKVLKRLLSYPVLALYAMGVLQQRFSEARVTLRHKLRLLPRNALVSYCGKRIVPDHRQVGGSLVGGHGLDHGDERPSVRSKRCGAIYAGRFAEVDPGIYGQADAKSFAVLVAVVAYESREQGGDAHCLLTRCVFGVQIAVLMQAYPCAVRVAVGPPL